MTGGGGHSHGADHGSSPGEGQPQVFSRILSTMVVVDPSGKARSTAAAPRSKTASKTARRKR